MCATFTFCFKTISWWRCLLFVWIVQPPIRHYTIGKEIVDLLLDRIRKLADNCTGREIASSVPFFVYAFGVAMIRFLDVDGLGLDDGGSLW